MARYDFRTPRLYVDAPLSAGAHVALDRDAANHLCNVLRLGTGDAVLLFNGRDGEWGATIGIAGKRAATATAAELLRPQPVAADIHYLFAPLKHARLDYVVQKSVELGVSRLQPVLTRHTQVNRINRERMQANVIEAAQQCGVLAVPEVAEPVKLDEAIVDTSRLLVFCDEDAPVADPVAALRAAVPAAGTRPIAVLIGPEGGFAEEERAALLGRPNILQLALGPRILRADTAAVAALALVQAVLGDWKTG